MEFSASHLFALKYCFMSSGLLPFVSGTQQTAKTKPTKLTRPKTAKSPDVVMALPNVGPNFETRKTRNAQLDPEYSANLRASLGYNSAFIVQALEFMRWQLFFP